MAVGSSKSLADFFNKHLPPRKIIFYSIFHSLHWAVFVVGWYSQVVNPRLSALNNLNFSVWISRGAALVLSIDVLLIMLPMCRNLMTLLRPRARWLPLDETQYFHRQVAYQILFWGIVHACAHYVNFFNVERYQVRRQAAIQIHYTQPGGITGHVMLLCVILMYTTAHAKIRQQSFETFWYTHHLFIPFLLAMYTHATGCFVRDSAQTFSPLSGVPFYQHCIGYEGWRWELVGGGLYLLERVYREIRSRRHKARIVKVIKHPYDVVEIQFTKQGFKYRAGQWLFLNCPSVSRHQWHPFTITSCPFDPYVSVHIRQVGDFTKSLASAVGAGPSQSKLYDELDPMGIYEVALAHGEEMPLLRIDGPYGAPAEDVFGNEIAVLIGTGIGVTPWASILKNIWHLRLNPDARQRLRRVEFIWVCKDTGSFEWFQSLLVSLEAQALEEAAASKVNGGSGAEFLRIHTYLTQRLDADTMNNIVLNSVGMDKDPLTELNSRTNFGRPDFGRLFTALADGLQTKQYALGAAPVSQPKKEKLHTDVGVYFCGPNAAARDIKKACKKATSREVKFRFWKEHF